MKSSICKYDMLQYYMTMTTTAKRLSAMGQGKRNSSAEEGVPLWRKAATWDAEQDPGFLIADVARLLRAAFERQIFETLRWLQVTEFGSVVCGPAPAAFRMNRPRDDRCPGGVPERPKGTDCKSVG